MNLTVRELILATDAEVVKCLDESMAVKIVTDSRKNLNGDLYLPIVGNNFDGHSFIEDAVKKGAIGYFSSNSNVLVDEAKFILLVPDTKIAYLQIARAYRRKINPITVAITGSSGKTTTKEMMYSVAAEKFKTHKTSLNHNNEIGLCQTMLMMPEDTQILIVELGMRGLGEIELLSEYSEPDIAIIANVGTAHIGRLGSLNNISKAKNEISKYLHEEGSLIANDMEIIKKHNKYSGNTIYFGLNSGGLSVEEATPTHSIFKYKSQLYELNIEGEHNIQNAIAVIEAGLKIGMLSGDIASGLAKFRPIEKRWESQEVSGYSIINDSYNANPDSVKAALKTFLAMGEDRKIVVLGDMGELGSDERKYHSEIGKFLEDYTYEYLITVGTLSKKIKPKHNLNNKHFDSTVGVAKFIKNNIKSGAKILLKASRSMKFEEIIQELK